MNTNSAFTGLYTENTFWYLRFDLRQIRTLRGGRRILHFNAADNCRLDVTKMKTMNFQDDILSVPIDKFRNFSILVFDLALMQDSTENFVYPQ